MAARTDFLFITFHADVNIFKLLTIILAHYATTIGEIRSIVNFQRGNILAEILKMREFSASFDQVNITKQYTTATEVFSGFLTRKHQHPSAPYMYI